MAEDLYAVPDLDAKTGRPSTVEDDMYAVPEHLKGGADVNLSSMADLTVGGDEAAALPPILMPKVAKPVVEDVKQNSSGGVARPDAASKQALLDAAKSGTATKKVSAAQTSTGRPGGPTAEQKAALLAGAKGKASVPAAQASPAKRAGPTDEDRARLVAAARSGTGASSSKVSGGRDRPSNDEKMRLMNAAMGKK